LKIRDKINIDRWIVGRYLQTANTTRYEVSISIVDCDRVLNKIVNYT